MRRLWPHRTRTHRCARQTHPPPPQHSNKRRQRGDKGGHTAQRTTPVRLLRSPAIRSQRTASHRSAAVESLPIRGTQSSPLRSSWGCTAKLPQTPGQPPPSLRSAPSTRASRLRATPFRCRPGSPVMLLCGFIGSTASAGFVLAVLSLTLCLSCLPGVVAVPSVLVPFGSLLNGCAGFGNARAAVALAVEDINNSTMLGTDPTLLLPPTLTLLSKDFCTLNGFVHASGLPYKATEFLTPAPHPLMVVGPVSSSEAVSSILQQGHITSIAPTNVVSLNKALFPYQATSDCLIVKQGDILADLASQLGWKEVGVLFNGNYQDLTNAFTARAITNNVRVVTSVSFAVADTTAGHNITLTTQMAALKASGARIFVLFIYQADIRAVFTAMADAGLTGAPYACMGSNEWLRFLYSASPGASVLPFLQGCVGTAIGTPPQSSDFLNFTARWKDKYDRSPASMFNTPAPLVTSLLFYNAAMAGQPHGLTCGRKASDSAEQQRSNSL